ncbi:hypothetical protein PoB_006428000 [Plakobranchus ocellatus]|uniref:Uncharacterized protein n=1 Tax=Plakobranchus ocellatus TaxID=259542 RepID=A0AAV4D122_9GAST|nr:hypothetical protein PoB_006428000 [Plakobranchus ocellatus]
MKEEVETAIKKMKYGKATGPDNISVELIEALEDFGIGKVTHLLNEIHDTGQIPTDLSKSIFIALPKKPDLFSLYSEIIMRNLENHPGIKENAPDTLAAKKTNERVLNEANKRRSLVRTIRKRQATFLGHVMRRGKLEHLVTTGKFEGKRSRGRQSEKIMDGLAT